MSPTARTLSWLRAGGWTAEVVERWNPYSRTRHDLGGGIDVLAWSRKAYPGCLGVQACATSSVSARCAKLHSLPTMVEWVSAGNQLWVVGWGLRGPAGARKTWAPTVRVAEHCRWGMRWTRVLSKGIVSRGAFPCSPHPLAQEAG